jgi:hypothetical protein
VVVGWTTIVSFSSVCVYDLVGKLKLTCCFTVPGDNRCDTTTSLTVCVVDWGHLITALLHQLVEELVIMSRVRRGHPDNGSKSSEHRSGLHDIVIILGGRRKVTGI